MTVPPLINLGNSPILVVDDEPVNVQILAKVLGNSGYTQVTTTTSPREAVELYRASEFDLVLLDINMPELNGFEVLDAFSESGLSLPPPVLVMTALSDRETRLQSLRGGARDFITKPFDSDEVTSRIGNLLEMQRSARLLSEHNQLLEAAVAQRTIELKNSQLETLQRLSFAGEYRDTETGEHTIRVGMYAEHLAMGMGLDSHMAEVLRHAAPMHDIGKIGIPDRILLKPGKLDGDEWRVMMTHTTIGARILADSDCEMLRVASTIAMTHHEKWDGSGYPFQHKGEEIPVVGRIVAIADVFDALTMERPYKRAWTIEQTVELIQESSGTHFDPGVVDVFMQSLPVLLDIREAHKDVVV